MDFDQQLRGKHAIALRVAELVASQGWGGEAADLVDRNLPTDARAAFVFGYAIGHALGMRDQRLLVAGAKSARKAAAARANGAKGGRPRKAK